MASLFSRVRASKHFKNGLPFFLFIGGGAFALKEFRTVRYDSNINIRLEDQPTGKGEGGMFFSSWLVFSSHTLSESLSLNQSPAILLNRANKLLTPEEAFGEQAKDINFKPKRSLEEELDVLKGKVWHTTLF